MRSLVILAYNEIKGSRALFDKIPFSVCDECVVVDGGSIDGTPEFYRTEGIRVAEQQDQGRGAAFWVGVRETRGDCIVVFSPDGNEDPADIPKLFELLEQGFDMAIASRFMEGSKNEEDEALFPLRKWVNMAFTRCANMIWHGKVTDSINGFRGFHREAFLRMNPQVSGFVIEYIMTIRALKLGLKIKELPTIEGQRIGGSSKSKSVPTGIEFLGNLFHEIKVGKSF
jgi:glycosyltransferase involved in cell wall biosynthesis